MHIMYINNVFSCSERFRYLPTRSFAEDSRCLGDSPLGSGPPGEAFVGEGWTLNRDSSLTASKMSDSFFNASRKSMDSAVVASLEMENYRLK